MAPSDESGLDSYLRLFAPYVEQLHEFSGRKGPYGNRFALLFRQTLRMLVSPLEINARVPLPFLEVARRYLEQDADTIRHFSYEENRHFFLSDLYDWLQIHERGRKMHGMGRKG